jgi:hypothetical protein
VGIFRHRHLYRVVEDTNEYTIQECTECKQLNRLDKHVHLYETVSANDYYDHDWNEHMTVVLTRCSVCGNLKTQRVSGKHADRLNREVENCGKTV